MNSVEAEYVTRTQQSAANTMATDWGAFINGKKNLLYFGACFNLAGDRESDEGRIQHHVTHDELKR